MAREFRTLKFREIKVGDKLLMTNLREGKVMNVTVIHKTANSIHVSDDESGRTFVTSTVWLALRDDNGA